MIDEDDDLTNGQADDNVTPAEGEQSEEKSKAKAKDASETGTDDEDGAEGEKPEGAGEDDEGKPKKSRSGIDRLKRERDALRTEVEMLRSRAPAADDSAGIEAMVRNEIGEPPKEADFKDDWFAYERALTAYETEKRIVTREVKGRAKEAAAHTDSRVQDLIEDFNERSAEAAAKIPDFADVVGKTTEATHPVSATVRSLILESEKGPLLQYHFAKNASDLRRINALPPMAAAREIGRLEARLSLAKPSTSTNAPPPVQPPKGGASPSSQEARMEAYLKRQYGTRV